MCCLVPEQAIVDMPGISIACLVTVVSHVLIVCITMLQIIRKVVEPDQLPPVVEYISAAQQRVKEKQASQRRVQLPLQML